MLGEARAAGLLPVAGVVPLGVEVLDALLFVIPEIKKKLLMPGGQSPEQRALEQRLGDLFAGTGHRDGDAEVALDALVLADQHIEDHAVDRVVRAVVGDDAHLRLLLAEAIDAAFALLVARWVPAQVVMQHRVEGLLKIDAFRQAVGADEDVLAALGDQGFDPRFALGRAASRPVTDSTRTLAGSDSRSCRAT